MHCVFFLWRRIWKVTFVCQLFLKQYVIWYTHKKASFAIIVLLNNSVSIWRSNWMRSFFCCLVLLSKEMGINTESCMDIRWRRRICKTFEHRKLHRNIFCRRMRFFSKKVTFPLLVQLFLKLSFLVQSTNWNTVLLWQLCRYCSQEQAKCCV